MPAWNQIETLLPDLDGTLLDLHFDTHFWLEHLPRRYAELNGLGAAEASDRILARLDREKGTLNWYCLDFWSRELGVDVLALKREVAHSIAVHPGAEAFLRQAGIDGKRIFPETTLLVDDSAPALRAARAFGLPHVLAVARPDSGAASSPHFSPAHGCGRGSARIDGVALGKSARRDLRVRLRALALARLVATGISTPSLRTPVRNAG